ncbi:MAG: AI-2E family transporter [Burkholderiales bacterium]|nr:AI-2E family transporter [Burkholderiales bacterium]
MRSDLPRVLWTLAALLLAGFLVHQLASVLFVFAAGAMLAYVCAPMVAGIQRRGLPRWLGVTLVLVLVVLAVAGLLLILIPLVVSQIGALVDEVPRLVEWCRSRLVPLARGVLGVELPVDAERMRAMAAAAMRDGGALVQRLLPSITSGGVALVSLLGTLFLLPILLVYFLLDWERMSSAVMSLVPRRHIGPVTRLLREIDGVLGAFLRGQFLVMLGLSVFYGAGLALMGLDSALSVGIITGMLAFVPYVGFSLGLLLGSFAAVLQFHTLAGVLGVWAVFVVGQVIEGYALTPWLVGDRVGLHPLWVLFAVLAGGALLGFLGVLLAVPAAAVVAVLARHVRRRYLDSALYLS